MPEDVLAAARVAHARQKKGRRVTGVCPVYNTPECFVKSLLAPLLLHIYLLGVFLILGKKEKAIQILYSQRNIDFLYKSFRSLFIILIMY